MGTRHELVTSPPSSSSSSTVLGTERNLPRSSGTSTTATYRPCWQAASSPDMAAVPPRNCKALERVIHTAQPSAITKCELPSLQELYDQRCFKKSVRVIKEPTHPHVSLSAVWHYEHSVKTKQSWDFLYAQFRSKCKQPTFNFTDQFHLSSRTWFFTAFLPEAVSAINCNRWKHSKLHQTIIKGHCAHSSFLSLPSNHQMLFLPLITFPLLLSLQSPWRALH